MATDSSTATTLKAQPHERSWLFRNRIKLAPWLFLAPGLIFFFIYVIAPIFQSIWISFYDWDGLGAKEWIGWVIMSN